MENTNILKERPTVRDILSTDFWKNEKEYKQLTLKDYGNIASKVGLLSMATLFTGNPGFVFPFALSASISAASKIGINSKKRVARVFGIKYEMAVLILASVIHESGKEIVAIEDTNEGCTLESKIEANWKTLGGTLLFNVNEENNDRTRIIGKSMIKGQLIDWGAGKKTINSIFDKIAAFDAFR